MSFKISAAIAAFASLWLAHPTPISAADVKVGAVTIDQAWSRATPGQARNGAVFFTLTASAADRLVRAESAVAGKTELHTHVHESGVMKMRPVEAIPVEPGKPTKLQPSGFHVMLLDLKAPLKVGDKFPLTLVFEKAGSTVVEVSVGSAGATAPAHTH